jgi:predicted NACHT family NTPase
MLAVFCLLSQTEIRSRNCFDINRDLSSIVTSLITDGSAITNLSTSYILFPALIREHNALVVHMAL